MRARGTKSSLGRRVAAGVAMTALGAVLPAGTASAHAILLNSDPPPQATVAQAPARIRLQFSEKVEVAFGAIRVLDGKAHRADEGRFTLAQAGREIDVPVHLRSGTYAVSWRVVSDDGHPATGAYAFFVGAPTRAGVAAVAALPTGDARVGWAFGAVRFLWFGLFFAIVGMVVVRRWVWTPSLAECGLTTSLPADRFRRRFGAGLILAWAGLLVAHAASLVLQSAVASGLPVATAARPSTLAQILGTSYGHYWVEAAVLVALAGIPLWALARRRPGPTWWTTPLLVLLTGVAVTTALNGHARTMGHPLIGVPSLAAHLLALGAWIGGLAAVLVLGLGSLGGLDSTARVRLVRQLIIRFGRLALAALAAVLVTGLANAVLDLGSPHDLFSAPYGRVLLVKLLLLEVALVLAARHAWFVPPRLERPRPGEEAVSSFRFSGYAELGALVAAVAAGVSLMVMVPGRSLALAAAGQVNLERRAGRYVVALAVDPSQPGANQIHVGFLDSHGRPATALTDARASLGTGAGVVPIVLRPLSGSYFVGDVTLPRAGTYRLGVEATANPPVATSFTFSVRVGARLAASAAGP